MLQKDKRLLLVLMVIGIGLFGLLLSFYGYDNTWQLWNINTYKTTFLDMRLITGGAESYAAGHDPAISDPNDPQQRIFNYPKVWYLILASGINQSWTIPISVVMIGLFLLSVYTFPGRLNRLSSFLLIFGLFSSATLFAVERANVDVIFFSSLTLALILLDVSAIASFIVLLVSILFKIFPVLGFGYFLGQGKNTAVKYMVGSLLFTMFYFIVTIRRMIFIFDNTPKGNDFSYGVSVLPGYLHQLAELPTVKTGPPFFYQMILFLNDFVVRFPFIMYLVAIVILIVFTYLGLRYHGEFESDNLRNLRAFWMGAGIYIGTFFIGNNWDYRLIFLLFTLPQLGEWAGQKNPRVKWMALLTLVTLFLSLWYFVLKAIMGQYLIMGKYLSALLDETANWVLFAGLIYIFASSLPDWIIDDGKLILARLFSRRKLHPFLDKTMQALTEKGK